MPAPTTSPPLWLLTASLLTGIGLACAPDEVKTTLRTTVRDLLRPGQMAVTGGREWTSNHYESFRIRWLAAEPPSGLGTDDKIRDERLRQLQAENVWLREQLRHSKSVAGAIRSTEPLLVPDVVEARVLGTETVQRLRRAARSILGSGGRDGIEGAALVLAGKSSQIDVGEDSQLHVDHLILAGCTVAGKVGEVGRYTSTLLPITDKQYRGLARLARSAGSGLEFGAEGILEGDGGDGCRLNFIQSTEPVSVGDSLYTSVTDGSLSVPLLYGTVVAAELPPGAPHWSIQVKPAADLSKLRRVQIVRTQPNPLRLNAH